MVVPFEEMHPLSVYTPHFRSLAEAHISHLHVGVWGGLCACEASPSLTAGYSSDSRRESYLRVIYLPKSHVVTHHFVGNLPKLYT